MSRAEQDGDEQDEDPHPPYPSTIPAPGDCFPQPRSAEPADLEPADVPVDNSAGPAAGDVVPPQQRQRRDVPSAKSTRHRSLG